MVPKNICDLYKYILKMRCCVHEVRVSNGLLDNIMYEFMLSRKSEESNMSCSITLSDDFTDIVNVLGVTNLEYGSTRDVMDVVKGLDKWTQ